MFAQLVRTGKREREGEEEKQGGREREGEGGRERGKEREREGGERERGNGRGKTVRSDAVYVATQRCSNRVFSLIPVDVTRGEDAAVRETLKESSLSLEDCGARWGWLCPTLTLAFSRI